MADRLLSIQSHVVSGYVGNKSATFPLQLLGFEVDAVNSVQFSNHTGYAHGVTGQALDDSDLEDLMRGLRKNQLDLNYSLVINGYIGHPRFLHKLAEVVGDLKKKNPDLVYVCDPVMGDYGPGMYVPETLLPVYKSEILPLADVCVPNQFEAELLIGRKIETQEDALRAAAELHDLGVGTVIFSSTELASDCLLALASKRGGAGAAAETWAIDIPKLPMAFVGTGDLFTALTTAWLRRTGGDLKTTLERTVATMQAVLKRTLEHAERAAKDLGLNEPLPVHKELKLIQSKGDIESPNVTIRARRVEQ